MDNPENKTSDTKERQYKAFPALRFIIKRILQTIPLLIIVSMISFFIIRLAPIDPLAELRLNPSISQETLDKEVHRLKLDKPIYIQYVYRNRRPLN